jgi:hypothetical protein
MYESKATLNYPFGEITIKVGVDGNVDRPIQMVTHMLSTAVAVTSIEAIQLGISDTSSEETTLQQRCSAPAEFGNIKISAEVNFDLKQHTPKRKLNDLAFGSLLPRVWQTASIYVGDYQQLTTPQAPLAQQPHKDILANIDEALGLVQPFGADSFLTQQQADRDRQRQLVTR